jgi:hypothetical protein
MYVDVITCLKVTTIQNNNNNNNNNNNSLIFRLTTGYTPATANASI